MTAASALVDNFNDNAVNATLWPGNFGTVAETGGQARVTHTTSGSGYGSAGSYWIKDSQVLAQVTPAARAGSATVWSTQISVYVDPGAYTKALQVAIDGVTGNLILGYSDGGTPANSWETSATYNAVAHAWLRLREAAGTTFCDTSPNGVQWTVTLSHSTPAAVLAATAMEVDLEAFRTGGSNAVSIFDNLNFAPVVASASPITTAGADASAGLAGRVAATSVVSAVAEATSGASAAATVSSSAVVVGRASSPAGVAFVVSAGTVATAVVDQPVVLASVTSAATVSAGASTPVGATGQISATGAAAAAVDSPAGTHASTTPSSTATATSLSPAALSQSITASVEATATAPGVTTGYRMVTPSLDPVTDGWTTVRFSSADVFNGNRFRNRGSSIVIIRNNSGEDVTATFMFRDHDPDVDEEGHDVVIPAGVEVTTAVWPAADYTQRDGAVWIDWSAGSGVELAVADCYPAW